MNTLDRIADITAKINARQNDISNQQVAIAGLQQTLNEYKKLFNNCPKIGGKKCEESRAASIRKYSNYILSRQHEIANLQLIIKQLEADKATLKKTQDTELANSELQTQLLGEQGLTAESIEIVAESEANAVDTQAETQAEIDKNNAETQRKADEVSNNQTLALKDKLKKLLPLFIVIVVILIALYIYKTKIK